MVHSFGQTICPPYCPLNTQRVGDQSRIILITFWREIFWPWLMARDRKMRGQNTYYFCHCLLSTAARVSRPLHCWLDRKGLCLIPGPPINTFHQWCSSFVSSSQPVSQCLWPNVLLWEKQLALITERSDISHTLQYVDIFLQGVC